jgi:hypothetical protein
MKDVISQAIDDYGIEDGDVDAFYKYVEYCLDIDPSFSLSGWGGIVDQFNDSYVATHTSKDEFARAYYDDSGELSGVPDVIVSNVQWLGVWYDELDQHFFVLSDDNVNHFFRKDV